MQVRHVVLPVQFVVHLGELIVRDVLYQVYAIGVAVGRGRGRRNDVRPFLIDGLLRRLKVDVVDPGRATDLWAGRGERTMSDIFFWF